MQPDIALLSQINSQFPVRDRFFLHGSLERLATDKPLAGMRIVNNMAITYETLCKLEPLLVAGADLTVTSTVGLPPKEDVENILRAAHIVYVRHHSDLRGPFDIHLDCGAQLPKLGPPRLGAVELTQVGSRLYQKMNPSYPVISVDDSQIKVLETQHGTGEAFVRAFTELTNETLQGRSFVLFGFGKVGLGVATNLRRQGARVTVVEADSTRQTAAQAEGFTALKAEDPEGIKAVLANAFAVVTATGIKHVLSQGFKTEDCPQAYLANIGTLDEFGPNFDGARILYNRAAINFALKHATLMKYIDPSFYAHNLAAEHLLKKPPPGFAPLNKQVDEQILKDWQAVHAA